MCDGSNAEHKCHHRMGTCIDNKKSTFTLNPLKAVLTYT